jgi:hypothetical protein
MLKQRNYNPIYERYIDDKNKIVASKMVRGNFYLIKGYDYVDGHTNRYTLMEAPIIFTLFVSKAKNIVHAVKVSNIKPDLVKKFFGKFVNSDTHAIELKGGAKIIYEKIVGKLPQITDDSYRTYKLDGLTNVLELKMDISKFTPKDKKLHATKIDPKSKVENK